MEYPALWKQIKDEWKGNHLFLPVSLQTDLETGFGVTAIITFYKPGRNLFVIDQKSMV
jgi:hypothetical protein